MLRLAKEQFNDQPIRHRMKQTLIIDLAYGKAGLRGESLHLVGRAWGEGGDAIQHLVPLSSISDIILCPQVSFSGALLQALMEQGCSITYLSGTRHLGSLMPAGLPHGGLRLAQYRRCADAAWCLSQARVIIATKIHNQAFMLRRRAAPPSDSFFRSMKQLQKATLHAADTRELMGIEGQASALYFAEWGAQLPAAFPFTGRSRRPPKDAVNACLSYLAALCAGEMLRAVCACGLDPDLGTLHTTEDYRHNLVLDLIEPFRPVLVEGVTRDLLTHGMLGEESTERHEEDGGCYLSAGGRLTVIRRYRQRLSSRFLQNGRHTDLRAQMLGVAQQWKQAVQSDGVTASNFKLT